LSDLKTKLSEGLKAAMKARDKERLAFSRNLHAAIRKKEIDTKTDLGDADVHSIASTLLKQRLDSISAFEKAGRDDLVAAEKAEAEFLKEFLPPQMSADELSSVIDSAIAESGAKDKKDIGLVMKVLMPKVKGKADGKLVNEMVQGKLS